MTANMKTSTTMLWLKQLTTSTFSSINRKVDRVAFLNRIKKAVAIIAAGWLFAAIGFYSLFNLKMTYDASDLSNFIQTILNHA